MAKASTVDKPRILVIGGEAARNFGSKDLKEAFDITHVERKAKTIPRVKNEDFAAVVILPWRNPSIVPFAEKWGKARGIPVFQMRSTGTIRYYLGEKVAEIGAYLKSLEESKKKEKEALKEAERVEEEKPQEAPPAASTLWDEDQLWDAYGESFIKSISGLDGETTDRNTFVSLMEDETGLKGEPVEVLISMMRRQGVITEHDGGVVSIGNVAPQDVEKRKKFIEREEKRQEKVAERAAEIASGKVNEEVEASSGRRRGASPANDISNILLHGTNEEVISFFRPFDGMHFKTPDELFEAMGKAGLNKDGVRFCDSWMRRALARAKEAGLEKRGAHMRSPFTIHVPSLREVTTEKPEEPRAAVAPAKEAPVAAVVMADGPLSSKPFEKAFAESEAATIPAPKEEAQTKAPLDVSKPAELYKALCASYPSGNIPDIGALVGAMRAFRGIFYDNQWDVSAVKGMFDRLRFKWTDADVMRGLSRKLDFTDDEWAYFALEYLRDKTLFSLLPMIECTNRIWKICEACEGHFHYNVPPVCWNCRGKSRL